MTNIECKHGMRQEFCALCRSLEPKSASTQSSVLPRTVSIEMTARVDGWSYRYPRMTILPYWKHCTRCGLPVKRHGDVSQWGAWRVCLSCAVYSDRPQSKVIYCMYCGKAFARPSVPKSPFAWCGGCRKWEHCIYAVFPSHLKER